MAVTVTFADGTKRNYPTATDAFMHGGKFVVASDRQELAVFDAEQVVSATVFGDEGGAVLTVPGRAKSK